MTGRLVSCALLLMVFGLAVGCSSEASGEQVTVAIDGMT